MLCTFCYNKGIAPPHTHSVRHWTLPNKPIICPELLSTKCSTCNLMGHTKLYCPKKTEKTEKTEKIGKKRNLPFTLLEQASNYQKTS
jgi:hypothetical protein